MSDRRTIMKLALGLEHDPARLKLVDEYLTALVKTCNTLKDARGEQDALAMAEAVAILLAIQLGGTDDAHLRGTLNYITQRALIHVPEVRQKGLAAARVTLPDDEFDARTRGD